MRMVVMMNIDFITLLIMMVAIDIILSITTLIMIRVSCAVGLLNIQIYSGLDPTDLIGGQIVDPASGGQKWQYLAWILHPADMLKRNLKRPHPP